MRTKLILSTTNEEHELWFNFPFIPKVNEWLNIHDMLSSQDNKNINLLSEGFPWAWGRVKTIEYISCYPSSHVEINVLCDDCFAYCEFIFIEIYFKLNSVALKAIWLPGNGGLSEIEYVACWSAILYNVKALKPTHLLIDASDLEYRMLRPLQPVFNGISNLLNSQSIAIVNSSNLLGAKTIENVLKNCSHNGHNIFSCREDGLTWFESFSSNISN